MIDCGLPGWKCALLSTNPSGIWLVAFRNVKTFLKINFFCTHFICTHAIARTPYNSCSLWYEPSFGNSAVLKRCLSSVNVVQGVLSTSSHQHSLSISVDYFCSRKFWATLDKRRAFPISCPSVLSHSALPLPLHSPRRCESQALRRPVYTAISSKWYVPCAKVDSEWACYRACIWKHARPENPLKRKANWTG